MTSSLTLPKLIRSRIVFSMPIIRAGVMTNSPYLSLMASAARTGIGGHSYGNASDQGVRLLFRTGKAGVHVNVHDRRGVAVHRQVHRRLP